MEQTEYGFIVHDPNKCALDTYILPDVPTREFFQQYLASNPDYTIISVTKPASQTGQYLRFGLQSCVSVVAYIIGIRIPAWCVTPHSLYKHILKDKYLNAREIKL